VFLLTHRLIELAAKVLDARCLLRFALPTLDSVPTLEYTMEETSMNRIPMVLLAALGISVTAAQSARPQVVEAAQDSVPQAASPSGVPASVPRLVQFNGTLKDAWARPVSGVASVTFAIYAEQDGGTALWSETQNVIAESNGHYSAVLGAATANGVPAELFGAGQSRWLGVTISRQQEMPRILLASVPYALKAADAETLGGLPASAYVTTQSLTAMTAKPVTPTSLSATSNNATNIAAPRVVTEAIVPAVTPTGGGTSDFIPIWTSSTVLGNSLLFQAGGNVGFNNTKPAALLDVAGNSIFRGSFQLMPGGTATASSGDSSHSMQWNASIFNSSSATAETLGLGFRAVPVGNNTASPSARLGLFYGPGGGTLTDTGFSIGSTGVVTFAPSQTFPMVTSTTTTNNVAGLFTNLAPAATSCCFGVEGTVSNDTQGAGVLGMGASALSGVGAGFSRESSYGVWADNGNTNAIGVASRGALLATADDAFGALVQNNSPSHAALSVVSLGSSDAIDVSSIQGGTAVKITSEFSEGVPLSWGASLSELTYDQGGSIELGGNNSTVNEPGDTPYIDFHFGTTAEKAQDYNARLINDGDGHLTVEGMNSTTGKSVVTLEVVGVVQATNGFDGQCLASGSFDSSGSSICNMDLAESYASAQATEPGDLVALVPGAEATVRKSGRSYEPLLLGVVSTNPGLAFDNGKTHLAGDNTQLVTKDKTVIALAGRVPVKISVENGSIRVGDPLTSSSKPGAAMKATRAGKIVGYALEPATKDGQVLMFVQAGYYAAPELTALRQENAQLRRQLRDLVTQVNTIRTKLDGNTLTASGNTTPRGALASH
jgi:hypothetical protein